MGYQKEDVLPTEQNNALSEMRQSLDASLQAASAENDRLRQIEELSGKISELTEEINLKAGRAWLASLPSEASEQTLEGQLVLAEIYSEIGGD